MAYLVGGLLALTVGALATFVHLDRDRAFYPTVLIVVASYYALFAVMTGSPHALLVETIALCVFLLRCSGGGISGVLIRSARPSTGGRFTLSGRWLRGLLFPL
jgi:hypothetical protein